MSLEEKLRAYAAKGELVHLSLAFSNAEFVAFFTAASPGGGHAVGHDTDPVEAIEKALKASPAKPARVNYRPGNHVEPEPATMTNGDPVAKPGGFSVDWTAP